MNLSNRKIWIGNNKELSEKVQLILFSHGCRWVMAGTTPTNLTSHALFIGNKRLTFIQNSTIEDSKNYFDNHTHKELLVSELCLEADTNGNYW